MVLVVERMTVQKTYIPKAGEITHDWYLVDANDQYLGRLASEIARVILGKNKANFTPGVDTGDFVVVINAERVRVTGNKLEAKFYHHHTGYPGGLKSVSLRHQIERHPDRVLRAAVWGMLPHNKVGRQLIKKLKIYAGPNHPHAAQEPKTLEIKARA